MDIFTFANNRDNNDKDMSSINQQALNWSQNVSANQHNNDFYSRVQNVIPYNYVPTSHYEAQTVIDGCHALNRMKGDFASAPFPPYSSEVYFYTQQQLEEQIKQNVYMLMSDYSASTNRSTSSTENFNDTNSYKSPLVQVHQISTPNTSMSSSSPISLNCASNSIFPNMSNAGTASSSLEELLPVTACQPQSQSQSDHSSYDSISSTQTIQFPVFPNEFFNQDAAMKIFDTTDASFDAVSDALEPPCTFSQVSTPNVTGRRASFSTFSHRSPLESPSSPSSHSFTAAGRGLQQKSKKQRPLATVCLVCGKKIRRDITRHLRTHEPVARFGCVFPHQFCRHKTGQFNRPYDFKKHLLNYHFKFDDPDIKKLHNLNDKLEHIGTCSCGLKFRAVDWLKDHVLTEVPELKCPYISK